MESLTCSWFSPQNMCVFKYIYLILEQHRVGCWKSGGKAAWSFDSLEKQGMALGPAWKGDPKTKQNFSWKHVGPSRRTGRWTEGRWRLQPRLRGAESLEQGEQPPLSACMRVTPSQALMVFYMQRLIDTPEDTIRLLKNKRKQTIEINPQVIKIFVSVNKV